MSTDDPFFGAGNDDSDRTVIRPSPGGRRPGAPQTPAYTPPPQAPARRIAIERGLNPLVAAAGPLLSLVGKLRNTPVHRDVPGLRRRMEQELRDFEAQASRAGVDPETVNAARYCLCSVIDETVLNTPWGNESSWGNESLLIHFYQEAWGGEKFFLILDRMLQNPSRHLHMLELMYLCLSLGFEGKYRVIEGGQRTLDGLQENVYRAIQQQRGAFEQELSPHWRTEEKPRQTLRNYIPLWVVAALAAVLLLASYLVFSYFINQSSAPVFKTLATIGREAPPPQAEAVIASPPPAEEGIYEKLKGFLAPEIEKGQVKLIDDYAEVTIRLRNKGLFASGRARVNPQFLPLLKRIAEAISQVDGQVLVAGHSDNVPIHTLRFPSNWHLSLARAKAVAEVLRENTGRSGEIAAEGRADSEPLVPNDTPQHRAMNRRVEIILEK